MKKKVTAKTAAPKTAKRTTRKSSSAGQTVLIHRVFIIASCVALFVVAGVFMNKQAVSQSVLGASVMRNFSDQATIVVPNDIPQASSYNIYYKTTAEKDFTNSVQNVSTTAAVYTIKSLKRGESYEYRFAAVDNNGKEFMYSETLPLTNLVPME